jgi:cytosine/adenosine deaminase-related metal-dependent hydrolase
MMSLNDDTLDALRGLADEHAVGMHLHVAEDATDALDAERNKRTQLERRLERLSIARPDTVVAHAVELAPSIVDTLASSGAFIATNPRSNRLHGTRVFSGTGEHVALGTDGLDGDVLAEARAYALRHAEAKDNLAREVGARIAAGQHLTSRVFGEPPPRVAPGARADLAVLDYDPMTPMTPSNLADHVSRGWSIANVRHTIAGGRFVLRDRTLTFIDERALVARARAAATRLWERMHGYC